MKRKFIVISAISAVALAGCGMSKAMEPLQDAPVSSRNSGPAIVGSMPDGFSNWAAKCDGPNMVYVLFKGDLSYGSIAVVPGDPRCKG